jgi:hypothetical protein
LNLTQLVEQTGCGNVSSPIPPRCPLATDYTLRDKGPLARPVMGAFAVGRRGLRGWGSGTGVSTVSQYQQNSSDIDSETAADMFLNWVYASQASRGGGFLDKDWSFVADPVTGNSCAVIGCDDTSQPGLVRYEWIQAKLTDIFSSGW